MSPWLSLVIVLNSSVMFECLISPYHFKYLLIWVCIMRTVSFYLQAIWYNNTHTIFILLFFFETSYVQIGIWEILILDLENQDIIIYQEWTQGLAMVWSTCVSSGVQDEKPCRKECLLTHKPCFPRRILWTFF